MRQGHFFQCRQVRKRIRADVQQLIRKYDVRNAFAGTVPRRVFRCAVIIHRPAAADRQRCAAHFPCQ